jgi:putative heme transporter
VMIAVAALGLLLVSPVLVKVYGHIGDTFALGPGWLLAIAAMIVAHFLSVWALYRVILRTSNRFDVAASQLAANATSHVAPAGSAVGAGIQLRMLTIAGFSASRAATALGATAVLGTVAGYLVLPLAVLVASAAGGGVPPRLVGAMWSAAAVLAILLLLATVLAARDRPWRWAAGAVTWVQHRFRRASDAHELGDRLINERNLIRGAIRDQAVFVAFLALAQPLTDYAALYLALLAVGAHVNPAATMAAFVVSNVAGLVPITPGGLGFVEAGLTRVLVVAGAARPAAHVAIATYRLAATWLPCLGGFVALLLFQRRHRHRRAPAEAVEEPAESHPSGHDRQRSPRCAAVLRSQE